MMQLVGALPLPPLEQPPLPLLASRSGFLLGVRSMFCLPSSIVMTMLSFFFRRYLAGSLPQVSE